MMPGSPVWVVASLVVVALLAGPAAPPAAGQAPAASPWPRIYEGAEAWANPNGRSITEDQVFLHTPYTHAWQSRSYYWFGRLDDGTLLTITPFRWKYGIFGSWGLFVLLVDPGGRVFTYDGELGNGSLKVEATGMRISAGATSFETSGGLHRWRVEVPGFSCDLSFTNILPAWMPGDGMAYYTPDGRYYNQYAMPAPWADFTGMVTVFGRAVLASGQCFYDTSESVMPLSRPNEEVLAFRALSPPGTPRQDRWFINLLRITSHRAFGSLVLPCLLLMHGDSWVLAAKDFSYHVLQTATVANVPYPYVTALAVAAQQEGTKVTGTFRTDYLFHVLDIFARLPPLYRAIASWFMKRPVVFRSTARFEGTVTMPDGTVHWLDLAGQGEDSLTR